jgi:hypothetical protein
MLLEAISSRNRNPEGVSPRYRQPSLGKFVQHREQPGELHGMDQQEGRCFPPPGFHLGMLATLRPPDIVLVIILTL